MHAPHQAPDDYLQRYRGRFDDGWDAARDRWFTRQLEMGLLPAGTGLEHYRSLQLLTEVPAPQPVEELPEAADFANAEDAASLDFLSGKDDEADAAAATEGQD